MHLIVLILAAADDPAACSSRSCRLVAAKDLVGSHCDRFFCERVWPRAELHAAAGQCQAAAAAAASRRRINLSIRAKATETLSVHCRPSGPAHLRGACPSLSSRASACRQRGPLQISARRRSGRRSPTVDWLATLRALFRIERARERLGWLLRRL